MNCPKCGAECDRDSVDVGVGVMHGPYGCPGCGWSESEEYDLSLGQDPVDERGGAIDQYGGYHPPGSARMEMKHRTVYQENETYAGWPANHGAWQWGDELLVGFMRGKYQNRGMHNVVEPFQKMLARSMDGGETWAAEVPNVDFEAHTLLDDVAGDAIGARAVLQPDDTILRLCGGYDHGGEYCDWRGGMYWSTDKGRTWGGPLAVFPNLPKSFHCTTRTCVLGDLVFLSSAQVEHWGSDFTICSRLNRGELDFVSEVLHDDYRAVMPAAVLHEYGTCAVPKVERIVVALRRRGPPRRGCWIDSVYSEDGGRTWSAPVHVADTGIHNGNPPALANGADGNLYCAYANRTDKALWVSQSIDGGQSWKQYKLLRQGECSDIGYPRLFRRLDGQLVCVYYWSDAGEPQHIEATLFN